MALADLTTEQIEALDNLFDHLPELGKPKGLANPLLGTMLQTLVDETGQGTVQDSVDALTDTLDDRLHAPAADITAIKAIPAADRDDGTAVVNLTDSAVWVFDADSAAAGDDVTVLTPSAGTGRWLLSSSPSGAPGFGAAGVSTASKGLVLDAQKAADTIRATTNLNVGGTGVPGAASVETKQTVAVTAFSDTAAKTILTITIPNAKHAAEIEVDILASLGAGGAIGAGEGSRVTKYRVVVARTAGVNAVASISAADGGAEAHVAGAASVTSAVATLAAVSGAVGATNTIAIQLAITKSGGASDNHTCVASARVVNAFATGITIA